MNDDLRYPIGQFLPPPTGSPTQIAAWISELGALPSEVRRTVGGFTVEQLDTPYRPGGWTVRQVVHHLPDSHLNGFIRWKWALTEDRPVIKAYREERWADLADTRAEIDVSLDLLDALHRRCVILLSSLGPQDLDREFIHPESGPQKLWSSVGVYAWHGKHHLAHIQRLAERESWVRVADTTRD